MATRYYAHSGTGAYLGGYDDTLEPPADSVETSSAPEYTTQIWNGSAWIGSYQGDLTNNTDAVAFQLLYNNAPWEMFSLFALLKFYGDNTASRVGCWSVIKSQSPTWLTSEWITNIESYCAAANIPLT